MSSNNTTRPIINTFLHPHDPSVENEYENLTQEWKNQLIDSTPTSPNSDYVGCAWVRLLDHYLDQQWLDSKQMLQCAQAWSARDSISLKEAVNTMKVLGLKSMQRSLDARQELLQTLGDPELMVSFGLTAQSTTLEKDERFSLQAGSEEEDAQVHAPLLVNHNNVAILTEENVSLKDEGMALSSKNFGNAPESFHDIDLKTHTENDADINNETEALLFNLEQEIKLHNSTEEDDDELLPLANIQTQITKRRLTPSLSTPNISLDTIGLGVGNTGFATRKYGSYYQDLDKTTTWTEIQTQSTLLNRDTDSLSDTSDTSSVTASSPTNIQWKSWFLNSNYDQTDPGQPIENQEFANEKVETDLSFSDFHITKNATSHDLLQGLMVRSESSVSAFRPISNNLAPRCTNNIIQRSTSEYVGLEKDTATASLIKPVCSASTSKATITKSRSFPSKSSLSASALKQQHSSSPMPHQQHKEQRNFMKSIVIKKVSLSKLFGSKKASSSAN